MKAVLKRAVLFWQLVLLFALAVLVLPVAAFAQDGDVIDPNTDLGMWALLVGAVLPSVVAFVQRSNWSNTVRAIVGVIASVIAGGITTWLTEGDAMWDKGMVHAILLTGVASWASYNAFWKPTGAAPRLEATTNPKPGP